MSPDSISERIDYHFQEQLIEHLEQSVLSLLDELPTKKAPSLGKRLDKEKHKDHHHPRDKVLKLFKKRMLNHVAVFIIIHFL